MQKKTISVIIPCYNIHLNKDYLIELLDCLQKQEESLFRITEVILINDSPTYNIGDFVSIEDYTFRIIIYNNSKNSGQAFSRNYGFEKSNGEYLHFIDQDDLLNLNFYSSINNLSEIIIADCQLFNETHSISLYKQIRKSIYRKYHKINNLKYFLLFDNIILSPGQAIFSRNVLQDYTKFPNLENYGSDDYGFMYKLAQNEISYYFSEKSIFRHRLHYGQGKTFLNLSKSRKEFFIKLQQNNSFFSYLCFSDYFNTIKKIIYLLFNNRLK